MRIYVICVNGAWYAASDMDTDAMRQCGLAGDLAYLSFKLLANHVATYGFELCQAAEYMAA